MMMKRCSGPQEKALQSEIFFCFVTNVNNCLSFVD